MPIHDWSCEACDYFLPDHYQPLLSSLPPTCPICEASPQLERVWSTNRMHRTFEAFEQEYNGQKILIDSIGTLRRFESYTLDQWKNHGGAPIVFRSYSQDNSNMGDNVFKALQPNQNISPEFRKKVLKYRNSPQRNQE